MFPTTSPRSFVRSSLSRSAHHSMQLLYYLAAVLLSASAVTASYRTCCAATPPPVSSGVAPPPLCPPFPSPPSSFPFASSPGCGHPFFQVRCAYPHSFLSIHRSPFLLLAHRPPHSLLLSPALAAGDTGDRPSLPAGPIDFSGTPFRLSPDPCPRLASLFPCRRPPTPANSSGDLHRLSRWQRRLLTDPRLLISACSAAPRRRVPYCHRDVAGFLADFLNAGIRVEWDPDSDPYFASCAACRSATGGACGFNDSDPAKPFLCLPSTDHLRRRAAAGGVPARRTLLLAAAVFAAACLLLVLISLWVAAALRRRWEAGGGDPIAQFLNRHRHCLHPPEFTYDELRAATGGFDARRKIGDGGFGSVYLAHLPDGRLAAVKRLHRGHPAASAMTKSFCSEVLILSALRHPNLVRLHGYCCDPRGLLLVYDYVPNGTLADHLHGGGRRHPALPWAVRVDVAAQTAAALQYLHLALKPPVVHRDVTSANIFVERDMRVKVGDFGLSRLLAAAPEEGGGPALTGPQGTPGYLDPDYHRSFRLTEKSDIYSFGVVLLELVTGMRAVDARRERREVTLADWAVGKIQTGATREIVDPLLVKELGEEAMGTVEAVAELAFRCVAGEKDDRPDARELAEELKRIRTRIR